MVLLSLVYRDQLFPRDAYWRTFEMLLARLPERQACRFMVDLLALALAHERGCGGELADKLSAALKARQLPDMAALRAHFTPDPAELTNVVVRLVPLHAYEALIGASLATGDAV